MHRNTRLIDIRHFMHQLADDQAKFVWNGIADGIRNINSAGAGFDGRFHDPAQVINWCAAGIFTGEFDIVGITTGMLDTGDSLLRGLL